MKTKLLAIILTICMILPFFTFVVQAEEPILTNVFLGKSITIDKDPHGTSYVAEKAVDGNTSWSSSRFSSKYSSYTTYSIEIDLATNHVLSYIRLYDAYQAAGINVNYTVEAGITSDGTTSYTVVKTASQVTENNTGKYIDIVFDSYVNADKIKVSAVRDTAKSVMINEIEGYGYEGTYTPPAPEEPDEEEEEIVDSAGYDELKLWYNTPAVDDDEGSTKPDATGVYSMTTYGYKGWEHQALPLGNGYLGAMVFGRTDKERIQLTENSLSSDYATSGLTNFAETYIDFNHAEADVTDYYRDLNLDEGTSHVSYTYGGVDYNREYITSYPDKVMAIKLTASGSGNLSFTLRPTIPYIHEGKLNAIAKKTGTVNASGDTVTIKGVYGVYNVKYEGQFTIVPEGSNYTMTASNDENGDNGTITLTGADSAIIYIAVGTNYPMDSKEIFSTANANKLDNAITAEQLNAKLKGYIDAAKATGYDKIREKHIADYQKYFGRVKLDLNTEVPSIPTDELVNAYRGGTHNSYLEVLLFHYGRYMLICSSREGTLPANLQGIWNRYRSGVCMVGYWHNVNVQLTYWPVFVTNLTDMFKSYADYFDRILPRLKTLSHNLLVSEGLEANPTGDSGWNIGTGASPYWVQTGRYAFSGNDGNGCGPFLAETFWDYYRFTGDINLLKDWVYPIIHDCANYSSRVVSDTGDGLYLTRKSASPENHVNGDNNYQPAKGDLYPQGTTYDQSLIYDIMNYALKGAEILKNEGLLTDEEYNDETLTRCRERIGKLDPIKIGTSGQIKEFREETYYGEYGQSNHRHISHLMGIYPGTIVNYDTPAWQDAARTTLPLRNSKANDWKWAMPTRAVVWARLGDGNQAMAQMRKMTSADNGIRHNLLTGTPTFQIDGNCGSTAAFSEMLLQSHMGYIQPLAALPDDWAKGSYDGLLARGAFEMGATWENGKATQLRILSQKGNECAVKYPGIGSATVKDSKGNAVSYTKNANDMITFATTAGESYVISSIPAVEETASVTNLAISDTELVDENRKTTLSWTASADAASYNVYYAVNDSADYTLAGTTAETSYQIPAKFSSETDRVTYAVTALSADGVESDRVWLNENPLGPIMDAKGSINEDGDFVITITPTYAVDSYNIYKTDKTGEKTLVKNTSDTVITIPDASPFYEIYTVVAVDDGEDCGESDVAFLENVALKKTVTTNIADNGSALPVSAITDGTSGRYASHAKWGTKPLIVEIDLGDVYKVSRVMLSERWMPEYTNKQAGIIIETGVTSWDGKTEWTTHTSDFMKSTGSSSGTIVEDVFYFDKITEADKLRVTYTRTEYDETTNYTITEIELYGVYEREYGAKNIALGKKVTSNHSANGTALAVSYVTDGSTGTRFASKNGITSDLVLQIDLESVYAIRIVEFWQYYLSKYAKILKGVDIETGVTTNGTTNWTKAFENVQLTGANGKTAKAATVDLGDMYLADKVKFTFKVDTTGVDTVSEVIGHSISEILIYGYDVNTVENISKNTIVETNLMATSSSYKEENLIDGKTTGMPYSSKPNGETSPCEIKLHLGGVYNLYQIKLSELISQSGKTCGDKVKVEVGLTSDGSTKWVEASPEVSLKSGDAGTVVDNVIVLDKTYRGDTVKITLQSLDGADASYGYNIAELRVYGDNKAEHFGVGSLKLLAGGSESEFTYENINSDSNTVCIKYNGFTADKGIIGFIAFLNDSGDVLHVESGTLTEDGFNFKTKNISDDTVSKIKIFTWDNITDIKPVFPSLGKNIPNN